MYDETPETGKRKDCKLSVRLGADEALRLTALAVALGGTTSKAIRFAINYTCTGLQSDKRFKKLVEGMNEVKKAQNAMLGNQNE
jgi:predicted DNA-binding protein